MKNERERPAYNLKKQKKKRKNSLNILFFWFHGWK